jgi:hypothetical protein
VVEVMGFSQQEKIALAFFSVVAIYQIFPQTGRKNIKISRNDAILRLYFL